MKKALEIIDQFYDLKAKYAIRVPEVLEQTLRDLESLAERIDNTGLSPASIPVISQCRQEIETMLLESNRSPDNNAQPSDMKS
jgi:hypothetical protein